MKYPPEVDKHIYDEIALQRSHHNTMVSAATPKNTHLKGQWLDCPAQSCSTVHSNLKDTMAYYQAKELNLL